MEDRYYLIGLRHIPGVGAKTVNLLLEHFRTAQSAWHATYRQLKSINELGDRFVERFVAARDAVNLEAVLDNLVRKNIQTVTILDREYPASLRLIYDPPPVLFYQGRWHDRDDRALAVVGARRATVYGKKVAEKFGRELAQAGFVIVSGMARGIDSAAHQGCLAANGRTIAVLGSGLDVIYPRENIKLAEQIKEKGLVMTEYPPGTQPLKGNFPARNRIIAGLSLGVLIVEAAVQSGALITADFALEFGREVFAVPGPITSPNSRGTHNLIKQGAKLVEEVADILEEFMLPVHNPPLPGAQSPLSLAPEEQAVYQLLSLEPVSIETLVEKTGWTARKVQAVLTMLELNGVIEQVPGRQFIKKSI